MWNYIAKITAINLIPKAIDEIFDWFTDDKPVSDSPVKKHSSKPFTKEEIEFIKGAYNHWFKTGEFQSKQYQFKKDLIEALNNYLGYENKSASSYSKIFKRAKLND